MKDKTIEPRAKTDDGFRVYCAFDELVKLDDIKPNPANPNKHPEAQIQMLAEIIQKNGWRAPITISKQSGFVVKGHARRLAGIAAGGQYAPVEYQDYDTEADEYADLVADNRIAELAVLDKEAIEDILRKLDEQGYPVELTGFTPEQVAEMLAEKDEDAEVEAARLTLQDKFIISPFTIMDARGGVWSARKQAWRKLGIKSEIGRGNDDDNTSGGLTFARSSQPLSTYTAKEEYEKKIGKKLSWEEFSTLFPEEMQQNGTSTFDPVLCEVGYRWFCPSGGSIIDPFAGGSVRGIVAALTGRQYTGVDLSERQIEANEANWKEIDHTSILPQEQAAKVYDPRWICGDSLNIDKLVDGKFDLLFTCPPYADLEVYSDKPEDISNKKYPEFLELYRAIIKKATAKLKDNSFAVCVVGDVRGEDGFYYNFVSDTIQAFQDAGMRLYNEAILVMAYGSLPIRVSKQFANSRKLGKAHQNILIFNNGNPAQSAAFDTGDEEQHDKDIKDYLDRNSGQLGQEHEKVLVFAKGDPKETSERIGVPDTPEDAGARDNAFLINELINS